MNILEPIPTPLHRCQYPGELVIRLGGVSEDGGRINYPGPLAVSLVYCEGPQGARAVAAEGICELIVKDGEPVELVTGEPAGLGVVDVVEPAQLAIFTGMPLAVELIGHMRGLLAQFTTQDQCLERTVVFRDPAACNDLICQLAEQYLLVPRPRVLVNLLAWMEGSAVAQMAWYRSHGPTEPGETRHGYRAEMVAFQALTGAYRAATESQLAGVAPAPRTLGDSRRQRIPAHD